MTEDNLEIDIEMGGFASINAPVAETIVVLPIDENAFEDESIDLSHIIIDLHSALNNEIIEEAFLIHPSDVVILDDVHENNVSNEEENLDSLGHHNEYPDSIDTHHDHHGHDFEDFNHDHD